MEPQQTPTQTPPASMPEPEKPEMPAQPANDPPAQPSMPASSTPAGAKHSMGMNKWLIYGGIAVVVIIILWLLLK